MKRLTQGQQKIVEQIRALRRAKKPLNISAMKRDNPRLLKQAMSLKYFRGWRKALLAAGVTYDQIRVEYRDYCVCAECGRELRTLSSHLRWAHTMTLEDYLKKYPGHETTCDEVRARSTYSLVNPPHWEAIWSREYIIDFLIFKHERGESLAPWDVYRDEQALHANIKAFFGTYRAAIKAAGIDYRDVRHIDLTETWTAEKVIERIQKLHRKQPLTCIADIRRRDTRLYDRCYHYFKSAVAAIEAAGIPYALLPERRSKKLDKRTIVRTIKVLDNAGLSLRPAALESHLNGQATALLTAASQRFGSWEQAVHHADIDYANHRGRRTANLDGESSPLN